MTTRTARKKTTARAEATESSSFEVLPEKISVKPAKEYTIYCASQKIRICPGVLTQVLEDDWVRKQIEYGCIVRV